MALRGVRLVMDNMEGTVTDKELAVIVTHGMGSQKEGFANALISEVSHRLDRARKDSRRVAWKQVLWSDLTEDRQQDYLRRAIDAGGIEWRRSREFVVSALGDASAYQRVGEGGTYFAIHRRIALAIHELYEVSLGGKPKPLVIVAHSLGGHIFSNYIWDMQHPRNRLANEIAVDKSKAVELPPFERMKWLAGIVTFGCNIPLFTFALDDVTPIEFPPPALREDLKAKARWLNFFDPDDILGYPLRPISEGYRQVVDRDVIIEVGNAVLGATPASHTAYWTDNDFTRPLASFLATFL